MKRTRADIFRINSPYGIIIRLSDLSYSWFNRKYRDVFDDSTDYLPFFILHSFGKKLKDESVLENLKVFAINHRISGMDMGEEMNDGHNYLRLWLYSDKYFPYNSRGLIIKKSMDRYNKVLSELEKIIGSSLSSS